MRRAHFQALLDRTVERKLAIPCLCVSILVLLPLPTTTPRYVSVAFFVSIYFVTGYFVNSTAILAALTLAVVSCSATVIKFTIWELIRSDFQYSTILWLPISFIGQLALGTFFISIAIRFRESQLRQSLSSTTASICTLMSDTRSNIALLLSGVILIILPVFFFPSYIYFGLSICVFIIIGCTSRYSINRSASFSVAITWLGLIILAPILAQFGSEFFFQNLLWVPTAFVLQWAIGLIFISIGVMARAIYRALRV